ncbi:uncharacterized protein LOC118757281, partial [Rhagoletis pomonella]|uniref:uncharacterized protein LOC118757281 n=1 Tax=Rhagoletis pomonella TaxID=28610 RepID=UPI0017859FA0
KRKKYQKLTCNLLPSSQPRSFKATASPLDTSATSAFKPTKSLDAGLNYTAFAHLNAPSAASSASPGSSYTLTRCATQPLHSQHFFNAATSGAAASTPPLRDTIGRQNSLSDSYNNSVSEQFNLSLGSDSERIFEMSGIEGHLGTPTEAAKHEGGDAEAGSGAAAGLARRNSVRARANMFQQLQEKTRGTEAAAAAATALSREEQRTSPRR